MYYDNFKTISSIENLFDDTLTYTLAKILQSDWLIEVT